MKKLFTILLMMYSWMAFSQSYNISLNPDLDIYPNIVRGINHGAWAQVKNNTPGGTPIKNVQFNWYISSDSILSSSDKIVDSRLVWDDPDEELNGTVLAYVGTSILNVPTSYSLGCNYYIIQEAKLTEGIDTDLSDNISWSKVCLVNALPELRGYDFSPEKPTLIKGVNSDSLALTVRIANTGSKAITQAFENTLYFSMYNSTDSVFFDSLTFSVAGIDQGTNYYHDFVKDIKSYNSGRYYMHLKIDSKNTVGEPNEGNNWLSDYFDIMNSEEGKTYLFNDTVKGKRIATCDAMIFDDGGEQGDYSANVTSDYKFYPSDPTKKLNVELIQYDVDTDDQTVIGYPTWFGSSKYTVPSPFDGFGSFTSLSDDGAIILSFESNSTVQKGGVVYKLTCVDSKKVKLHKLKTTKPQYVKNLEEVIFDFNITNIGYSSSGNIDYLYGVSSSTKIEDSIVNMQGKQGSIAANATKTVSLGMELNSLNLNQKYYLFVATTDFQTVMVDSFSITEPILIEGDSILFENNEHKFLKTCNATLFDDGGASNDYTNNFSGEISLFPANTDEIISLIIDYDVETNNTKDVLSMHTILDNSLKLTMPAKIGEGFTYKASTEENGGIKLMFQTNESITKSGFKIKVACIAKGIDLKADYIDVKKDTFVIGYEKLVDYELAGSNVGTGANEKLIYTVNLSTSKDIKDKVKELRYSSLSFDNDYLTYKPSSYNFDLSFVKNPGMYYFIMKVDHYDKFNEIDEENNFTFDSIYIANLPSGEYRFPFAQKTDTVKQCNVDFYGTGGKNAYGEITRYYKQGLVFKPVDAEQLVSITIDTFALKGPGSVNIYVYDREVSSTSSVAVLRSSNISLPFHYVHDRKGAELDVVVQSFSGYSIDYVLNGRAECTGITTLEGIDKENSLVYPNITSDEFRISKEVKSVILMDLNGNQLKNWFNQDRYSVKDLNSGMYILYINLGDKIIQEKLIVE